MSMDASDAVLQINPQSELRFKGPFTDVVTCEINLTNISEKKVCFKIKTTAPKQYCVRPNCGVVEPGKTAVVSVMLQPFDSDAREKMKHKFLVMSMYAPDVPVDSVDQLWKDPPTDQLYETKLRCVFDLTSETAEHGSKDQTNKAPQTKIDFRSTLPAKDVSPAKSIPKVVVKPDDSLLAEHKELLEENKQLKLESQRLRKVLMTASTSKNIHLNRSSESGDISLFTVGLVAVIAIVFGLLLGKFII